ncbi:mCG147649 [Mus musculus]|jgi:hypothetical protein|nr:mCG147649 [Mus musculus]
MRQIRAALSAASKQPLIPILGIKMKTPSYNMSVFFFLKKPKFQNCHCISLLCLKPSIVLCAVVNHRGISSELSALQVSGQGFQEPLLLKSSLYPAVVCIKSPMPSEGFSACMLLLG